MYRMSAALFCLFMLSVSAFAQKECKFGSAEGAEALKQGLHAAKSCKAAADLLDKCMWGSSADTGFSAIAVEKCENEFLAKLSPAGRERYMQQMQLCSYRYARAEGTMSISAAAMCQMQIAEEFALHPAKNNHKAEQASFDCNKAQSPLEKAICGDPGLGHADLVLERVYADALKLDPAHRAALATSERQWLKVLPEKCGLTGGTASKAAIACLRNQFEEHFTSMDSCGESVANEHTTFDLCLKTDETEQQSNNSASTVPGERASFSCETPKTALEIVICADQRLGQADIQLDRTYREAQTRVGSAEKAELAASEKQWLDFVRTSCPLGVVGGIPPVLTRACVRVAFETRTEQLAHCTTGPAAKRSACLNDFKLMDK